MKYMSDMKVEIILDIETYSCSLIGIFSYKKSDYFYSKKQKTAVYCTTENGRDRNLVNIYIYKCDENLRYLIFFHTPLC